MSAERIDPNILRTNQPFPDQFPIELQFNGLGIYEWLQLIHGSINNHATLIDSLAGNVPVLMTTPEQFFAVGDGVTDDGPAFRAMDAAIAAGSAPPWVFLNAKTYVLGRDGGHTYSFNVTASNVRYMGVPGATWLQHPTNMPATSVALVQHELTSNVGWYGVGFDGNWGNPITYVTQASSDAAIGSTINVISTAGFPTSGTIYVATTTGISAVTYTSTTATSFGGCTGSGYLMRGFAVGLSNTAAGLNHQTQGDPKNYLLIAKGVQNLTVDGCMFRQCYGDFVWIGGSAINKEQWPNNTRILNCTMDVSARHGIDFGSASKNTVIVSTRVTNTIGSPIHAEPSAYPVRNVFIDKVYLDGWFDFTNGFGSGAIVIEGGDTLGAYATNGPSAKNWRVQNSTIRGTIYIEYAENVTIAKSEIVLDWPTNGEAAVEVFLGSRYITIDDCDIYSRCSALSATDGAASSGVITISPSVGIGVFTAHNVRVVNTRIKVRNGKHGILCVSPGGDIITQSGTATSITATTLVQTGAGWTSNAYAGGYVRVGASFATVKSNTVDTLTLTLADNSVTSAWVSDVGEYAPTPAAGAFVIIAPAGLVEVTGCEIDCRDDGNGAGGNGVRCTVISGLKGMRVRVKDTTIKGATGGGVAVRFFAGNTYPLIHLQNVYGIDDQPTPTMTAVVHYQGTVNQPTKWIMSNIVNGEGVAAPIDGLTSGVWLVRDGNTQEWSGFGAPTFTVGVPSTYTRVDAPDATHLLYVNPGGSTWTAK